MDNIEINIHEDSWVYQLKYLTGTWLSQKRFTNILIDIFWKGPRK